MAVNQAPHLLRIYIRFLHGLDLFLEMVELWTKSLIENERFLFSHTAGRIYTCNLAILTNRLLDSCGECCLGFVGFRPLIMYLTVGFNDGGVCDYSVEIFDCLPCFEAWQAVDRKSTRLNSSHTVISYAVF